ncbi:MAG: asparaginase domain-containing protein, partial [Mycobacteriales bacterium]
MGRRIALIGLGGTIVMAPSSGSGIVPAFSPEKLLSAVPGLAELGVEIEATELRRLPSPSLGFADARALSDAIEKRLADGCLG